MPYWRLKAAVQKTISYLPLSARINFLFQKYVTRGVQLTNEYFIDGLGHARVHLEAYGSAPPICLELGTCWYPTVPIAFFLAGSDRVYSVDIKMHTNVERITQCIHRFLALHEAGTLGSYVHYDPQRLAELKNIAEDESLSLEEILGRLRMQYLIEDARELSLANASIDLVNSNNTFEHIYPDILEGILKEFVRIVKKDGGVMSHFIDMSDHFSHLDTSITPFNFLKFSDTQWQRIDNSLQPQNRMRLAEYENLYHKLGIPITELKTRKGSLSDLSSISLSDKYQSMDAENVA